MTAMQTVGRLHAFPPQANVIEAVDHYLVELDVSGFAQEELRVDIDGTRVTVVADQTPDPVGEEPAFQLRERLEESFRLPDDSDPDGVAATFEHGTLELNVPKLTPRAGSRTVPIRKRKHGLINPSATPS